MTIDFSLPWNFAVLANRRLVAHRWEESIQCMPTLHQNTYESSWLQDKHSITEEGQAAKLSLPRSFSTTGRRLLFNRFLCFRFAVQWKMFFTARLHYRTRAHVHTHTKRKLRRFLWPEKYTTAGRSPAAIAANQRQNRLTGRHWKNVCAHSTAHPYTHTTLLDSSFTNTHLHTLATHHITHLYTWTHKYTYT